MKNLTRNTTLTPRVSFYDSLSYWGRLSDAAREYGAVTLDGKPVTTIAETRRTFPRLVIDVYASNGVHVKTVHSADDIPRPAVFDGEWLDE